MHSHEPASRFRIGSSSRLTPSGPHLAPIRRALRVRSTQRRLPPASRVSCRRLTCEPRCRHALAELCPDGSPVAVRSSASDEDGVDHSFAGQLESYLFVQPEDVAERVAAVWRSGFSTRLLAYRQQHGLTVLPHPPAVLVQRMVGSTVSGVAFSADPVSGRRSVAVVSAALGLGTGLVSGECDADTWHVDRAGAIISRSIVAKRAGHRRDDDASRRRTCGTNSR